MYVHSCTYVRARTYTNAHTQDLYGEQECMCDLNYWSEFSPNNAATQDERFQNTQQFTATYCNTLQYTVPLVWGAYVCGLFSNSDATRDETLCNTL